MGLIPCCFTVAGSEYHENITVGPVVMYSDGVFTAAECCTKQ